MSAPPKWSRVISKTAFDEAVSIEELHSRMKLRGKFDPPLSTPLSVQDINTLSIYGMSGPRGVGMVRSEWDTFVSVPEGVSEVDLNVRGRVGGLKYDRFYCTRAPIVDAIYDVRIDPFPGVATLVIGNQEQEMDLETRYIKGFSKDCPLMLVSMQFTDAFLRVSVTEPCDLRVQVSGYRFDEQRRRFYSAEPYTLVGSCGEVFVYQTGMLQRHDDLVVLEDGTVAIKKK